MESELTNKETLTIIICGITAKLLGSWRLRRPYRWTCFGFRVVFRLTYKLTHTKFVTSSRAVRVIHKILLLNSGFDMSPVLVIPVISFNSECLSSLFYCHNQLIRIHFLASCVTFMHSSLCSMRHVEIFPTSFHSSENSMSPSLLQLVNV